MTIQAPEEHERDRQPEATADRRTSQPAPVETSTIEQTIGETKGSIYSRFIKYEDLNRELLKIVTLVVANELIKKRIGWYSMERIREVVEFIMRTAKQRGWEEEHIQKAADEILKVLNSTGLIRTSEISNKVSRLLEGAVLHI